MVHPLYPKLPPLQIRTNKMKIVHFDQCYCKTNTVEQLWFFMHFFSCNFENPWKTTSINFSSWSSSQFIKKSARKIERLIVKKIAFFSCIFQDKKCGGVPPVFKTLILVHLKETVFFLGNQCIHFIQSSHRYKSQRRKSWKCKIFVFLI